jgi:cyclopropane-fatty-acyl-phospholipid synthase
MLDVGQNRRAMWYEPILALDILPDRLIRRTVRARIAGHEQSLERAVGGEPRVALRDFARQLREQPIAVHTEAANAQHYEVPADFFAQFLGPRMKYSACYWPAGVDDIAAAEEAMLALTCERAGIADGMDVLDLGCGWGSLSLYVAERFPAARVLAVSNSTSQGAYVRAQAERLGLHNVEHLVGSMVDVEPGRRFDRIVSVEMFEHLRNYELAFRRLRQWLTPDGLVFLHVFSHRQIAYRFDGDDWMGRTFFTGGTMPARELFAAFDDDLVLRQSWHMDGLDYARTLECWLERLDAARDRVWPILSRTYGARSARRWWVNWRLFFIVCAETFASDSGRRYGVSHYLLAPVTEGRQARSAP